MLCEDGFLKNGLASQAEVQTLQLKQRRHRYEIVLDDAVDESKTNGHSSADEL